jgi:hypothetical protein
MAYLTQAQFQLYTLIPTEFIARVDQQYPGFIDGQLELQSAFIDSRLRKRYDAPFKAPYPLVLQSWLARLVTMSVWLRRGFSPTDEDARVYQDQYNQTLTEIKEAADSENGWFDIPLRQDTRATGVINASPHVYSEAGPYVWTSLQRRRGREEDENGGGTFL